MDLQEWFLPWLAKHLERHANQGLPDHKKKPLFYENWRDEFAKRGITHAAVEEASKQLATMHYTKHEHFHVLLKLVREAKWATSFAEAKEASQDCRECYGEGLASRICRNTGMSFAVFCVCPYGTWRLRKAKRQAKPDEVQLDLASIRNGQTYRAVVNGQVVTLDFTEDEHEDFTHLLPRGLRDRAEKLRPRHHVGGH